MIATFLVPTLLLFAAAAHPFVTYPLTLRLLARLRSRPLAVSAVPSHPRVALCVCFYNEERIAAAKVENMLAQRAVIPELDILTYVDAATDRTAEVLRRYEDRIRVVVAPRRTGKTQGMNTLVAMTDADIVAFSDANVMFDQHALKRLAAAFDDPAVGCACGHLIYTRPGQSATASTGSLYWRLEERIKALESATGSVMGADGSIFAMRRALYQGAPPDLIDDMYVSLWVLCGGSRIVRVEDALAFEEAVSQPAEEFRRKIRIACQAFNVHRALRPRLAELSLLDRYKYVSHKLLRWLAGYLLAASGLWLLGALASAGAWQAATALVVAATVVAALMLRASTGPLAQLREVLAAFVATAIGVWCSLRGKRFQTWSPPASARGAAA
jgi:cellulose synthase/poly-beta-1,6-N-acetylglucosamine synthase-like glycosyltransferase